MRIKTVIVALLCVVCLGSCLQSSRRIPEDKLASIYADMYMADQWLNRNPSARRATDSLRFYEPIMLKYGYSFEEYDNTVRWYVDHPERYLKVFRRTVRILDAKKESLTKMVEIDKANRELLKSLKGKYDSQDFWPAYIDSLNFTINAQRRDSVRTDPEPEVGTVVGDQPAAVEREIMQF